MKLDTLMLIHPVESIALAIERFKMLWKNFKGSDQACQVQVGCLQEPLDAQVLLWVCHLCIQDHPHHHRAGVLLQYHHINPHIYLQLDHHQ